MFHTLLISLVVLVPLLIEARRAARNERAQRARGGIEPPNDVYRVIRIAYPASYLAMILEGSMRGGVPTPWLVSGLVLFALAKALKWWAIVALGDAWTFRVIVVPGAPLVSDGPYRYLRHPNYAGVAGELVAVALMTGAVMTGPIAVLGFGFLMWKRIAVEERVLGALG